MMKNFSVKYIKIALPIVVTVLIMYLMVYIDVVLRARHAYLQAEKYFYWYEHPEEKQKELLEKFNKEKQVLDEKLSKNKISKQVYTRELEIAKFNYDRELEESAIKYAHVWYQTTVELFSPPESKYVKLARKKLPVARELWKKELHSKGIKVEDYMLE
ncbi:MAG: hypothetical protein QME68_01830 [Elusimicrobiota bacterium]|nr:hypothetical protein [Elusimicrobiota bacterium]